MLLKTRADRRSAQPLAVDVDENTTTSARLGDGLGANKDSRITVIFDRSRTKTEAPEPPPLSGARLGDLRRDRAKGQDAGGSSSV